MTGRLLLRSIQNTSDIQSVLFTKRLFIKRSVLFTKRLKACSFVIYKTLETQIPTQRSDLLSQLVLSDVTLPDPNLQCTSGCTSVLRMYLWCTSSCTPVPLPLVYLWLYPCTCVTSLVRERIKCVVERFCGHRN